MWKELLQKLTKECEFDVVHDTDELVVVLEEMEVEVEGYVHHPRYGDELLVPARANYSARNVGSSTALWLYGYKRT